MSTIDDVLSSAEYFTGNLQDRVLTVTFNRPQSLNALNLSAVEQLTMLMNTIGETPDIRVVIFTGGEGKAFIAGADIKEMANMSAKEANAFAAQGQKLFTAIEQCAKPTIAAVNGFALGGGLEFALACDVIIASENARFALPEVSLGLIPGWGGTVRLMRKVGIGQARRMILTGAKVKPDEAKAIGLVEQICVADQLSSTTNELANAICRNSPNAMYLAKRSMAFAGGIHLEQALSREAELFGDCFDHGDRNAGIDAFINKRQPTWSDV